MTGASLLIVFVLAKAAVLWRWPVRWGAWTPIAFFWEDVLVALAFGVLATVARRTRLTARAPAIAYTALTVYVALNIPLMLALSTPLTWPMLRATSGTLADSILLYATLSNVLLVLSTLAAAAALPFLISRAPRKTQRVGVAAAVVIVVIGPPAAARVDTRGLDRNVVIALVASALPHVHATSGAGDYRTPPFEAVQGDDLTHLRGIARGRNVVLVSLESTAAEYLRLYGSGEDVTPHLDELARHALVFDSAYAVYPESIKGLFSVLCSTSPAFDTAPEQYETAPCQPLPAILSEAGYRTALFHSGRFAYLGMESIVEDRGFDLLEDAGDIGGRRESSFGVDEPSTVERMLAWIDALPTDQPFFLMYLPIAGHHPYATPEPGPFDEADEIGRYRNAVWYGDRSLGALVEGLRARGLEKDTIWIVIGDHGEAFGQHQGNFGHTFFLYDENVHVPFLIAMPHAIERMRRSRTTVSLVDTAPTILDLLGLPVPPQHQGRSVLDGTARMALFFTDYSLGLVGLRDGRWKFVHELESRRSTLFDLARDPGERIDMTAREPERAAAYERTLRAWSAAQKRHILAPERIARH